MNRRRTGGRTGDYRPDSWWVRDHGGMPGWAIVALSVLIVGIFGMAALSQLGV